MKFAKVVFTVAGIWGILILTPLYFLYDMVGRSYPPAITHPDFYFGFISVSLAWQLGFLVIGMDPVRFRPMMIPAIGEKAFYVISLIVLFQQSRIEIGQLMVGVPDFILGCLFTLAFFKTKRQTLSRLQRVPFGK